MTRPAVRRSATILLAVGALIGLIIRYRMLFYIGIDDMKAYHEWGKSALETGLPSSYHGIYFPIQYQVFEVCAWNSRKIGCEFFPCFQAVEFRVRHGIVCLMSCC